MKKTSSKENIEVIETKNDTSLKEKPDKIPIKHFTFLKDNLDNIALNFQKMNNQYVYMKQTLIEFKEEFQVSFKECHVAICQNGGLIGICKKKGYLDISKGSQINKYILVTYQNLQKIYFMPIDWNYREKWVVDLEFNDKEQLYAICNDGTIFKIDILTERALPQKYCETFKTEPIIKANLVDDGFIALTVDGNFYFCKDIKNPVPKLVFPMKSLLDFSNNVEFLAIPPSKTRSQKLEILIANQKGEGVIHIEDNEGEGKSSFSPDPDNPVVLKCQGLSVILQDKIEPYLFYTDESQRPEKKPERQTTNLGRVIAMAISPKKDQIAVYDANNYVFFFFSNFKEYEKKKIPRIELNYEDFANKQFVLIEHQKIINYEEGCQFLFCGEDAVALCGYRYAILINALNKPKEFKIIDVEKIDPNLGASQCKCISEVDGLRYMSSKGIYFISKVPTEFLDVSDPFTKSFTQKLAEHYSNLINKKPVNEKLIRDMIRKNNLASAIFTLQMAGANCFWTKNDKNTEKQDTQLLLLEAAQHYKSFVKKDEFNFQKFYDNCKHIRIVNNLRNHTYQPKMLTYKEYLYLTKDNAEPKNLLKLLCRSLNFGIANKITQYLEEESRIVYEKYAIASIKKIANNCDTQEEEKLFERLNYKLSKVNNFSFINLAKKAFKYNKNIIGMKLLDNEKSILAKLPKYLDAEEWDKVFELTEKIYDSYLKKSIIEKLFEKIVKKDSMTDFSITAAKYPNCKNHIIQLLKKHDRHDLDNYMMSLKNPEEMFFYCLEQYFQSSKYSDRQDYISLARDNLKLIDNTVNPNFEHKFYKNYLDSLESNLSFKSNCYNLDKPVISDINESFDISVYDLYKRGVAANKYDWIVSQNKNFNFSSEGMSIMRFIALLEARRGLYITENILRGTTIKKLGLTNLNASEIFYNFKQYKDAAEYLKNLNDPLYFDYKMDMLNNMDPKIAMEVIILDKNISNVSDYIKNMINKDPKLINTAKRLSEQYKITLNLE